MIHGPNSLAEVTIQKIEAYLLSRSWIKDAEIRTVATVWHRLDSIDAEIVLPISTSVKDYDQRLYDAIRMLSLYEKRSISDLINDLARYFSNLIAVRVIGSDTDSGTIPISDGVLLFIKAKELLYSAAMSMYAKKKQFSGALPKDSKSYIDSLLLGQTEIGSYVINIIAPVQFQAINLNVVDEYPFAEAVTHNLLTSIAALVEASNMYKRNRDLTVFETAIAKGASSNMCDALIGFSGEERRRDFEVRICSAAGQMFSGETRVFSFVAADIEILQKASGYYKDDYILPDREVCGFVKKLHRPKGEESGTITIESMVGETERSVQIQLEKDDYHEAVVAHDTTTLVKCLGDIQIKSRSAKLLNPTDFRIVGYLNRLV